MEFPKFGNMISSTKKDLGETTSSYGAVFTLYLSYRFSNFSNSQIPFEGLGGWVILVAFFF